MAYGQDIKLQAKALWVTGAGSDQQIADRLGITRAETLGDWRRSGGWDAEKEHIQQLVEERISVAVAETVSELNSRHMKEYQLMQTKGVQGLKIHDPKSAAEAAAMLDSGIRGERLVRGEPTEVREVRSLMQTNVQVLELVVADVIRALIEGGTMDKRAAKSFAEEFAKKVNHAPFRYAVGQ
jgi:transposase-like protein